MLVFKMLINENDKIGYLGVYYFLYNMTLLDSFGISYIFLGPCHIKLMVIIMTNLLYIFYNKNGWKLFLLYICGSLLNINILFYQYSSPSHIYNLKLHLQFEFSLLPLIFFSLLNLTVFLLIAMLF